MKDRDLRREGDRFLAEGMLIVERAVRAGIELESVLVEEGKAARVRGIVGDRTTLLVCSEAVLRETAGFVMHQGVVAVGRVKAPLSMSELRLGVAPTIVVCPEIQNVDNMGLLVRVCAGLGVDAMVLGPSCCDPWYRRSVRVSMGAVFVMPMVRSDDIKRDLEKLRDDLGFERVATVLDDDALPLKSQSRRDDAFPGGVAVLLGSEPTGLPPDVISLCDRKVCIPMAHDVDSLNVGVAAGIVVHHFVSR